MATSLLSDILSIEELRLHSSSYELPVLIASNIKKIHELIGCANSSASTPRTPMSRTPIADDNEWVDVKSRRIRKPIDSPIEDTVYSNPSPVPKMKLPYPDRDRHHSYPRYVSKFKSNEKVDDTIMNTIIRGKLNKFNALNYDEIRDFMCQILDSGESDFLKQFMLFVFVKSTEEEIFCPLYVKLLSELCKKYTIIQDEMKILFEEYLNIFKEKNEYDSDDQYENFLKKTGHKKHRLGYSQFLTELVNNDIIECTMFIKNISTICSEIERLSVVEGNIDTINEYTDCVLKMLKILSSSSSTTCLEIKRELRIFSSIWDKYTTKNPAFKSVSSKARFTCMDICDICKKNIIY